MALCVRADCNSPTVGVTVRDVLAGDNTSDKLRSFRSFLSPWHLFLNFRRTFESWITVWMFPRISGAFAFCTGLMQEGNHCQWTNECVQSKGSAMTSRTDFPSSPLKIFPLKLQSWMAKARNPVTDDVLRPCALCCLLTGISGKSQVLFALVFTTRYLDLLTSFISLYNTTMKVRHSNIAPPHILYTPPPASSEHTQLHSLHGEQVDTPMFAKESRSLARRVIFRLLRLHIMNWHLISRLFQIIYIGCAYATVYLIYMKFKATYDGNHDTFRVEFLVVPIGGLAFLVNHEFSPLEVRNLVMQTHCKTFPQLFMLLAHHHHHHHGYMQAMFCFFCRKWMQK